MGRTLAIAVSMSLAASVAASCAIADKSSTHDSQSQPAPVVYATGTPLPPTSPGPAQPPNFQPTFGATQTLADAPPPISGGTLVISPDGTQAYAADPDRDRVYLVYLGTLGTLATVDHHVRTIQLQSHDEPGRLVLDDQNRLHVVLRRGGAIVTIDVGAGAVLARRSSAVFARRSICAAPRGIDYDVAGKRLIVACESGELYSLDPSPLGGATLLTTLASGLRDVVVVPAASGQAADESIFVSRFRTAEMIALKPDGTVLSTTRPTSTSSFARGEATFGWRLLASGGTTAPALLHQFSSDAVVAIPAPPGGDAGSVTAAPDASAPTKGNGGYGAPPPNPMGCSAHAIVRAAVSGPSVALIAPDQVVMPVDGIWGKGGFAILAAGNGHAAARLPQVFFSYPQGNSCAMTTSTLPVMGQGIAIAVAAATQGGTIWVQSREPAQLEAPTEKIVIPLAPESREDTGHAIFHSNSGAGIACASCHAEGGDDGHVWTFTDIGKRRTPSLQGTIAGTAPYHWGGDMPDIATLADEVMTTRMSGPSLSYDEKAALETWLFAIPRPARPAPADWAAVFRGKALFERTDVGCSACHSGPRFTNNATADVGTGGAFQVPPLVGVRTRAPYLHDGCASTLEDRFGPCGGAKHGNVAPLSASDVSDLVAYLASL
jgi:cytochrome c